MQSLKVCDILLPDQIDELGKVIIKKKELFRTFRYHYLPFCSLDGKECASGRTYSQKACPVLDGSRLSDPALNN